MNTELFKAIDSIIRANKVEISVNNKEAAAELSQLYIDNGGNGIITGPFYERDEPAPVWCIEK